MEHDNIQEAMDLVMEHVLSYLSEDMGVQKQKQIEHLKKAYAQLISSKDLQIFKFV